jgi:RNA polymerase sigma-70 factor, ECF subfamily
MAQLEARFGECMSGETGEDARVRRAIAGEPLALEGLLLDYYAPIASRVEQLVPASLRSILGVDDLVQETFAEAFRAISSFVPAGPGAFAAWLGTIADHRALDAIRAQKAAKRGGGWRKLEAAPMANAGSIAALVDLIAVSERTPSRSVSGREAAAAVHVALAGLRPEYRDALRLRYLLALPVAEVAGRMGKTESAVHKLCARGLQQLRESLGDAGRYLSRA